MDQPTTEKEYFAYILLSLAYADTELVDEEVELIKKRLSQGEYETLHDMFKRHSDAEGLDYIRSGAEIYLGSESDRKRLGKEMIALIHADQKVSQMETVVMNYLNRIIAK